MWGRWGFEHCGTHVTMKCKLVKQGVASRGLSVGSVLGACVGEEFSSWSTHSIVRADLFVGMGIKW